MQNYKKITGIVVSNRQYKEKDRLVSLLTEEGRVEAVAKGACSYKSHWVGRFELLNELELVIFLGKTTTITQAYVINAHLALREELKSLAYGLAAANLVFDLTLANANDSQLYQLFKAALNELEKKRAPELTFAALAIKALKAAGIFPQLNYCVYCHENKSKLFFNFSAGGLVCSTCLPGQPDKYLFTPRRRQLFLTLYKTKFTDLANLNFQERELKFIMNLIWEHLTYHLPTNQRVQAFLEYVS